MSIKRKFKVREINGEIYIISRGTGLIPTGCATKDELLAKFDLVCNYAIETTLVSV